MRKYNVVKLFIVVVSSLVFSCNKDDKSIENINPSGLDSEIETSKNYPKGTVVLGKQLGNPFELEVMQKAYDNILSQNPNTRVSAEKLKETHLYIKFMPADEKEFMILKADSTLDLYNYPLDYEIEIKGNSYQDPEVPVGKPTYQYCSVEAKKLLPKGIKYKVLAKLYIPKNDSENSVKIPNGRVSENNFAEYLENEAYRLISKTSGLKKNITKNARIAAYTPAGRITMWDDSKWQNVGIEGVEVRARVLFTTHKGYTDANGNYTCNGTFNSDANYSIDWERYNFALRDGWLSGAFYNGPKKSGDWNLSLNDGAQMFYARIFTASYRYYYKAINGLRRPPENSFWGTQMHIRAHNSNGGAYFTSSISRRFLGLGNPIHIYSKETTISGTETTASSERTFYTVIHELAHASHWEIRRNNNWNGTDNRLIESWAMGVGWILTRLDYPNHNDYVNMTFDEMRNPNFGQSRYTPIIIDLIDNINQGGCCSTTMPIDVINGYTIKNIEDVLKDCTNLTNLRDQLKSKYDHPQEAQIDTFFAQYINL